MPPGQVPFPSEQRAAFGQKVYSFQEPSGILHWSCRDLACRLPDGIQDELDICHKMERGWSTLQAIESLGWTTSCWENYVDCRRNTGVKHECWWERWVSRWEMVETIPWVLLTTSWHLTVKRCEAAAPAVPAPPNPYDFQKPLKGPHFQHLPISSSLFPEDFAATCHVEFELKSIPWHFLRKTWYIKELSWSYLYLCSKWQANWTQMEQWSRRVVSRKASCQLQMGMSENGVYPQL